MNTKVQPFDFKLYSQGGYQAVLRDGTHITSVTYVGTLNNETYCLTDHIMMWDINGSWLPSVKNHPQDLLMYKKSFEAVTDDQLKEQPKETLSVKGLLKCLKELDISSIELKADGSSRFYTSNLYKFESIEELFNYLCNSVKNNKANIAESILASKFNGE